MFFSETQMAQVIAIKTIFGTPNPSVIGCITLLFSGAIETTLHMGQANAALDWIREHRPDLLERYRERTGVVIPPYQSEGV